MTLFWAPRFQGPPIRKNATEVSLLGGGGAVFFIRWTGLWSTLFEVVRVTWMAWPRARRTGQNPNTNQVVNSGSTMISPYTCSRTFSEGMTGPSWHPLQSHLRNEGTWRPNGISSGSVTTGLRNTTDGRKPTAVSVTPFSRSYGFRSVYIRGFVFSLHTH